MLRYLRLPLAEFWLCWKVLVALDQLQSLKRSDLRSETCFGMFWLLSSFCRISAYLIISAGMRTTDTWYVCGMCGRGVAVAGLPTDVLKETLIGPGCQGLPPGSCLDACAAAWPRRGKSLHGMAKSVEDPEIRSKAKTLELAWRRHGWPLGWLRMLAADVGHVWFSVKRPEHDAMAMPCHAIHIHGSIFARKSVQARLQKTKSFHRWVAGKPGSSSQVDQQPVSALLPVTCGDFKRKWEATAMAVAFAVFAQATEALQLQCQRGGEHPIW